MRKYKFKLESLLKIRKLKEKKIKIQIAGIVKEMELIKRKIKKNNKDIDEAYASHEKLARETSPGRFLQFFPYFLDGKKEENTMKENLLYAFSKKYNTLVDDLKVSMGEVKVIEKIKEKDYSKYKKELLKEEDLMNEETMTMRYQKKNK